MLSGHRLRERYNSEMIIQKILFPTDNKLKREMFFRGLDGNEIIESKIENKGFEYPYVIKSCSGHGGSQVFLVNNRESGLYYFK